MQTLSIIPECTIQISTVEDGSMSAYEDVAHLYQASATKKIYMPEHLHGTDVVYLNRTTVDIPPTAGDIIITDLKDLSIIHQFADCVPFLCIDRKKKVYVFSHLGWKGLVSGGVHISVLGLCALAHSELKDLWVWIGPCIQKASYTFTTLPLQMQLPAWEGCVDESSIDLPAFILKECSRIGIDLAQVINDGRDTYSMPEMFFSHRRVVLTNAPKGVFTVSCSLR